MKEFNEAAYRAALNECRSMRSEDMSSIVGAAIRTYLKNLPVVYEDDKIALIKRIARLNPDAGEIGAGMLRQLVVDARSIVGDGC